MVGAVVTAWPSQKLVWSSFAVDVVKSGSRLLERPLVEVAHVTESMTVAPRTIWTSGVAVGLIEKPNVPTVVSPPFIVESLERAKMP